MGSAGSSRDSEPVTPAPRKEWAWDLWLALPIQPGAQRPTVRTELVPGKVWAFEQTQGVLDVIVNVRMTAVKLTDGSLFVYAPVAPTAECKALVDELGPVKYVVLPTTAVEHKVFFGPFCKAYPDADIYAVPGQWSFPLNLPLAFLGLFPRRANTLREEEELPWGDELDCAVLQTPLGLGPYVEAAFFHRATRTLLVTDVVVKVPETPPEVCEVDARPLLNRAKDDKDDVVENTREGRVRGWGKTVLFALFFQPEAVSFSPLTGFTWAPQWPESLKVVTRPSEPLIVAPILQALVLTKRPKLLTEWVDKICAWNFQRVVPAHFVAPIKAGPKDFRRAFGFEGGVADAGGAAPGGLPAFLQPKAKEPASQYKPAYRKTDMKILELINQLVVSTGVITLEE